MEINVWVLFLLLITFYCVDADQGALIDTGITQRGDDVIIQPVVQEERVEVKSAVPIPTEASNEPHQNQAVNSQIFSDNTANTSSPSVNSHWWLDIEAVEKFKTLSLPHSTYKQWSSLSLLEKLPYLIDRSFLVDVKNTYLHLCTLMPDTSCKEGVTLHHFLQHGSEFNTADKITAYFKDCDSLVDLGQGEKGNGKVTWVEYVVCRGYYDATGNPHDVSEFDFLDNIVIMDYQRILNDPNHPLVLQLIERDEL